ncbi:uncharacterized protein LOC132177482 [Corylus avellana]|uniref:uncharacterized protein LOC132177482 n=1 Tax=Corylus avellana TaxID=13451 RepID=UPI00286D3B45|nr:uncharacterized protein LOC132177482 [Corylus avellana]
MSLVVKEVGVDEDLGGCSSGTPVDVKLTGLIQSRKWLVGFGPSNKIVVWDQGDEVWDGDYGDFSYPLDAFSPDPLDWVLDCDEDEDPTLALLDVVKEDFLREERLGGIRLKARGSC